MQGLQSQPGFADSRESSIVVQASLLKALPPLKACLRHTAITLPIKRTADQKARPAAKLANGIRKPEAHASTGRTKLVNSIQLATGSNVPILVILWKMSTTVFEAGFGN